MQTKAGNPKMPPYRLVSRWVLDWMATRTTETIAKAFTVWGITHPDDFDVKKLHPPLRYSRSGTSFASRLFILYGAIEIYTPTILM